MLLDDARGPDARPARLYARPVQIVATRKAGEVAAALEVLRVATRGGLHAAGYLSYEAGASLEPRLAAGQHEEGAEPLLWFGLFRDYQEVDDLVGLLPDPLGAWLSAPIPGIDHVRYGDALDQVQALIAAGDLYQANLTFQARIATQGSPLALYAGLRARAAGGQCALVATGRHWLLSLSPELFFDLADGTITTRPMKGTATRGIDKAADDAAAVHLQADPKQRAENLMIVDLLRNDLSRVAQRGSVDVPELFAVERYPTVLQMTSTVTARIEPGRDAIDVLQSLFPCGSITGAPKIRSIEALREIEGSPRGIYTGSIGRIDPDGDAVFNVAIRTLAIEDGQDGATMGLGSGIVADSEAPAEWAECLAKGAFVASTRRFDLIETMAFDPRTGLIRLERHLERMKATAAVFGFDFDRHAVRNELQAATFRLRGASRVRMLLSERGHISIEVRSLPVMPDVSVAVGIAHLPVEPEDFRLRHKLTDRNFYDRARGNHFETLFVRPDGAVTEGTFTNIFVEEYGRLLTPPLADGLLGGVLRAELIEQGRAIETRLSLGDLADGFFIGNSLRGLLPAHLAGV